MRYLIFHVSDFVMSIYQPKNTGSPFRIRRTPICGTEVDRYGGRGVFWNPETEEWEYTQNRPETDTKMKVIRGKKFE